MPYEYIIEMICDWWAFSWAKNNLNEIFSWYNSHKSKLMFGEQTAKTVDNIIEKLKNKLEK